MEVDIKDMPTLRVATVRHVGPYNQIPKAFEHLAEAVAIQLARDAATKPRKPMIRLMQARPAG